MIVGVTVILDIYFEKHPVEFEELEADAGQNDNSANLICFYYPSGSVSAKISLQKIPYRILYEQAHDRLVQKYHQQHDFQILKTDYKKLFNPSVFLLLHIKAGHYYFNYPKEDPSLLS